MMGKHKFAPKPYYELSLDHLLPQDHLLRQISASIDFSFIESSAGYPPACCWVLHSQLRVNQEGSERIRSEDES
jgi:hypothetical protein